MKKILGVIAGLVIGAFCFAGEDLEIHISLGSQYQNIQMGINGGVFDGNERVSGLNLLDLSIIGINRSENLFLTLDIGAGYLDSDKFMLDKKEGSFTTVNGGMEFGYLFINNPVLSAGIAGGFDYIWAAYDGKINYKGNKTYITHTINNFIAVADLMVLLRITDKWGITANAGLMTSLGGKSVVEDSHYDSDLFEDDLKFGGLSYKIRAGFTYRF